MKRNDCLKQTLGHRTWRVVYIRSKWEKKTHKMFKTKGIESFCPLVRVRRRWADRVKTVETPLFNSYVFVHVSPAEQLQVLQTSGVVNFVQYCGKPALVPHADIKKIRELLENYEDVESINVKNIRPGDKVIFNDGIFFDTEGEVLEINGKSVLIVMKQLDCALVAKVRVDAKDLCLKKN